MLPRQVCGLPLPNVTWSMSVRVTSSWYGSSNTVVVPVAGGEPHDDLVALLDLLAAQLDVAGRGAPEVVDRRRPAQELLDGARDQFRPLLQDA